MKEKKKNLTLTELMVIIAIIALFIALLLPANRCSYPSPRLKAKSYLAAITIAIKQYEITYGILPFGEEKTEKDMIINGEYQKLMELLSCVDGPDQGKNILQNARGIRFLDVPNNFEEKGFRDPWGNEFKIFIDTNYDGEIIFCGKEVEGNVLAYSFGENKIDDKGEGDDICSWK